MALENKGAVTAAGQVVAPVGDFRYVARQPILDARGQVLGYELLFCDGPDRVSLAEGDQAFRSLLDNTVLFGLEQLSGGLSAFVHCTAESLGEEWLHILPPGLTVWWESVRPRGPAGLRRRFRWAGRRVCRPIGPGCFGLGQRPYLRSVRR